MTKFYVKQECHFAVCAYRRGCVPYKGNPVGGHVGNSVLQAIELGVVHTKSVVHILDMLIPVHL